MMYHIFIVVGSRSGGVFESRDNAKHFYLLAVAAAVLRKARQAVIPEVKW